MRYVVLMSERTPEAYKWVAGRGRVYAAFRKRPLTVAALATAILAHAVVAGVSVPFFQLPEGAEIRPMAWAAFVLLVSFLALVLTVPLGVAAVMKEKPRICGAIGVIGGLTPFITAIEMLSLAQRMKGLEMLP